jgi:hypothetical protein
MIGTGLPDNELKQQLSLAYLRALATAVGCSVEATTVDFDGIDATIRTRGPVGRRQSPVLDVQLKCTHLQPDSEGVLCYPLGVKNYNELVLTSYVIQRILVVLCVPEQPSDRIVWTEAELLLRRCAYWINLAGREPTGNKGTKQVELTERMSPEALARIFEDIGADREIARHA